MQQSQETQTNDPKSLWQECRVLAGCTSTPYPHPYQSDVGLTICSLFQAKSGLLVDTRHNHEISGRARPKYADGKKSPVLARTQDGINSFNKQIKNYLLGNCGEVRHGCLWRESDWDCRLAATRAARPHPHLSLQGLPGLRC